MSERREIIETVIDWKWLDVGMALTEFLAHIAANITAEHMARARVVYESNSAFDDSRFQVFFMRLETDEELSNRLNRETIAMEEQHERLTLARLKAKYEGKS